MTSVMVDGRYLGSTPSGIGRYCQQVIGAMQRQRQELTWGMVLRRRGDEGALRCDYSLLYDRQAYGPHTSLALPLVMGRRPADLFHSPFHVLPRGLRCPSVMTMHDVFNFTQPKTSNYDFPISWIEWGYFLSAIPDSLKRASRVVCVSQTTADELVKRVPGCASKLRVIHHGVTPLFKRLEARQAVTTRCRELVGERPFLMHVGAVSPNKNQFAIMRAFSQAFPRDSGPSLVTISRFGDIGKLKEHAQQLGLRRRHIALASSSDDDMLHLLNGALGLVFYSLVEGFGLPILEAMACGCPVLTSSLSCMPEVVGDAALLADPTDIAAMAAQMRQLYDDSALQQQLRDSGLARAATFTWERAAALHLEVYDEALR